MTIATIAPPDIETLADLLHRLGDIPLDRIRFHPYPGTATEQDVIESPKELLCELVDGVLVGKSVGFYESWLGMRLGHLLMCYLEHNDRGIVLGAGGPTRMKPGLVRMPSVGFYSWRHFPNRLLPAGEFLEQAPDLAIEIFRLGNTELEMDRKRGEYFAGGASLVWQVYPESRRVRVYSAVDAFVELDENQTLEGGTVLPGFTLSIRDWFEQASERES